MNLTATRLERPARLAGAVFVLALLAVSAVVAEDAQAEPPPNIVFILADDLGWTDLGCYGSGYYETPHIDRLCREGLRFTTAYTNGPNCAPTRACLMSGRYSPRHGIYTVNTGARGLEENRKLIPVENRTSLPLEEVTIAEALQATGYKTGCFGKWHLGNSREHAPEAQGFDVAAARGEHPHPATKHLTDRAIEFIRDNAERPFFCYVPYHAVHTPIRAPEGLVEKYRGKAASGEHDDPEYAAMLELLDTHVGRILETLDELQLGNNTIVVFTSDNGGVGGYATAGIEGGLEITHNTPLHGGKGMLYEGGIRVPLLVRWPGTIEAASECDEPVLSIDFYPTFLDIAATAGDADHHLDGVSMLPLWRSSGSAALERQNLYWHFPGYLQAVRDGSQWRTTPAGAIRNRRYKLIEFFETGRVELYDLQQDIGETRNLLEDLPEVAKLLHRQLIDWRKSVGAPMPQPKDQTSRAGDDEKSKTSGQLPNTSGNSG